MSFFDELKRRNVFKVAAAYIIVAWLLMQVGDTLAPALLLPGWITSALAFFLILGFPLALFFAWAFELTPDGLKKEKNIDKPLNVHRHAGQKLNYIIIALLAVALGYFVWESRFQVEGLESTSEMTGVATGEASSTDTFLKPGVSAPGNQSIAVLPFANRSNVEEDLFFTDGIHDDLLTQLAKIGDLKVISRTSVMAYRDTSKQIPEIAKELGVATILEGGIQRAGQRIRINAQLIDVSTDEHLWAETFDREMTVENIFDIQSEIARQIVTAVRGELSSEESDSLTRLPTENLEAYEAYMHAKAAMNEPAYTADKYLRTEKWAAQAVTLDPDFTWGWSLLVEAHAAAIWIGYDASADRLKALNHALKQTMARDPDAAEAQSALGTFLYNVEADYASALTAYQKSSARQPGNAHTMYQIAAAQRRTGQFDESIASYEKALRLDPANDLAVSDYLLTLMFNAEYEKGVPLAVQAIQRFPQTDILRSHLGFMLIHWKGDIAGAREQLNGMSPSAGYEFVTLATRLPLYEREFERALATWDLPEVIRFSEYSSSPSGWRGRVRGEIHLLLGQRDTAFAILNKFIEEQSAREPLAAKARAFQLINVALAYALTDRSELALETMEQATGIVRSVADHMAGGSVDSLAARILALAGQTDRAIQEIERLIDTPASRLTRWSLTLDPRWDFLRDNQHFNDLIRPKNLQETGP